jgi:hypothetical protein
MAIFHPRLITDLKIKNSLNIYLRNNNIKPRIFSRYDEFIFYIKTKGPKYIFTISKLEAKDTKYKTLLLNNSTNHLVSLSLLNSPPLKGKKAKIGIVQFQSIFKMKATVIPLTKRKIRSVKSVPKEEELIPLLAFKAVDNIIIYRSSYNKYKSKFYVKLKMEKIKIENPKEYLYIKTKNINTKLKIGLELLINKKGK